MGIFLLADSVFLDVGTSIGMLALGGGSSLDGGVFAGRHVVNTEMARA